MRQTEYRVNPEAPITQREWRTENAEKAREARAANIAARREAKLSSMFD
jgi:hypothetical protein